MVLVTTLMRLVSARYGRPVDVVSAGPWTRPLLENEPSLGHLQLISSRKTPYLLCPSQWQLVRWLRGRGRGPVYVGDIKPDIFELLRKGGVHQDDIVALDPDSLRQGEPMLWPDRWLALGKQNTRQEYSPIDVDPAQFRLPGLTVTQDARSELDDLAGARETRRTPGAVSAR